MTLKDNLLNILPTKPLLNNKNKMYHIKLPKVNQKQHS